MDIPPILSEYYKGQEWTLNGDSYEGLIWYDERNTLPKPTLKELTEKWNEYIAAQPLKELRKERDTLLAQTDRYALPDWPHETLAKQTEWVDYRQALRDLPNVTEDPANPVWPVRPDEVVEEETSNVTTEEKTSNVTTEEETSNVTTEEETSSHT
ncbi:phage tail assembly chaperone [bacterium]|nr:phage tail assembly chaperone [bacterium]